MDTHAVYEGAMRLLAARQSTAVFGLPSIKDASTEDIARAVDIAWRTFKAAGNASGEMLPPVPTPKRVATAVRYKDSEGDLCEIAALGQTIADLRRRWKSSEKWTQWGTLTATPSGTVWLSDAVEVTAAHAAFEGAGDVLPGEETTDA